MGLNGYQRWNCTLFRYGTVIRDRTELYLVMAQLPEMGTPKILSNGIEDEENLSFTA